MMVTNHMEDRLLMEVTMHLIKMTKAIMKTMEAVITMETASKNRMVQDLMVSTINQAMIITMTTKGLVMMVMVNKEAIIATKASMVQARAVLMVATNLPMKAMHRHMVVYQVLMTVANLQINLLMVKLIKIHMRVTNHR